MPTPPPAFDTPMGMSRPPRWVLLLLAGLVGCFVVQLGLAAVGVPVLRLAWSPLAGGFAVWQPITRFVLWNPADPIGILISAVVAGLLLPSAEDELGRRGLAEGLAASALVATVAVLGVDGLLLASGAVAPGLVLGWGFATMVLITWFGLARPAAEVRLYFVLPIRASWIVWGSLGVALLLLLAALANGHGLRPAVEQVGAWLGAYGWWQLRGPGGRRRRLSAQGRKVEKKLGKVIALPTRNDTWH